MERHEANKTFISRENGDEDKCIFLLRYIQLSEAQKDFIIKAFSADAVSINKARGKDWFVATVDLTPDLDANKVKKINHELGLEEINFGVWIDFTSNYDHSGIRMPIYVNEFYKVVGGQFDISIITG